MLRKFNEWLDSLPDEVWLALLIVMSFAVSYTILGGMQ